MTQIGALLGLAAAAAAVVLVLVLTSRGAAPEGDGAPPTANAFLSLRACKKCHFRVYRSWRSTRHAHALDLLEPGERMAAKDNAGLEASKDYTRDAACLPCHVTGYGEPGGYPDASEAWTEEEWKAAKNNGCVGCESCHGAGERYVPYTLHHETYARGELVARGLLSPVTVTVCKACHNARSPTAGQGRALDLDKVMAYADLGHEHWPLKYDH